MQRHDAAWPHLQRAAHDAQRLVTPHVQLAAAQGPDARVAYLVRGREAQCSLAEDGTRRRRTQLCARLKGRALLVHGFLHSRHGAGVRSRQPKLRLELQKPHGESGLDTVRCTQTCTHLAARRLLLLIQ